MSSKKTLIATHNTRVAGTTGNGKAHLQAHVTTVFLTQSYPSELKNLTTEEGRRLAEVVRRNCTTRILLKPGGKHHDR